MKTKKTQKNTQRETQRYTKILGTGSYMPDKVLTNADLEKMIDTTDQWIVERTGIRRRHVMSPGETSTSMAETACRRAIEAAGIAPEKIGLIICATSTPDNLFPNVASRLQFRLNINQNECASFDINAACSGFIYALSVADKYIRANGIDYALVVGVESLTKLVDWTDRSTCILFSDGAGAAVLGVDKQPGVYSTHLHADGRYTELLGLTGNLYSTGPGYIQMQGNEVFKVAVKKLGEVIDEALAYNKMTYEQVNWLIPHQANIRIIQAMAKKLKISMDKVILTIEEQGNTSAASIPLALDVGIRDGRIKRGDIMLFEAFGAGFTWGAALVKY